MQKQFLVLIFFLVHVLCNAQETLAFGINSLDDILVENYQNKSWLDKLDYQKLKAIKDTVVNQNGWVNFEYADLDIKEIYQTNGHEGIRLGIGVRTSQKLNSNFQLNGRLNYGTKDKVLKYAVGAAYLPNTEFFSKVYAQYEDDVTPFGKHRFAEYSFPEVFSFRSELSNLPYYLDEKKWTVGYSHLINHNLNVDFSVSSAEQRSLVKNYEFLNDISEKVYHNFSTKLDLRYSPNEVYIKNSNGKFRLKNGLPIYHFSVDKGWNFLGASQDYLRLNFTGDVGIDIIHYPTFFTLDAGKTFGEVPLWQYFESGGKDDFNKKFLSRFILGGSPVFETMLPGEFFSDVHAYLLARQQLYELKFGESYTLPIEFLYKIGIGDFSQPKNHSLSFKTMDKPFQEIGLEFNRMILDIFGIGFYYRIGEYQTGEFSNDFAVKGTLNL